MKTRGLLRRLTVNTENQQERISKSAWITIIIVSSTLLVMMLGETMLIPAIPDIMREFGVGYNQSAWIFSSFLIVGAVMIPVAGKLSDTYNKKKVLLALFTIYIIGTVAGGFSNNFYFLIAARMMQGLSIASIPVAFSIIRDILPEKKLAIGIGIFTSAYNGGSIIGILVGASIIENLGWHSTFFSVIPISILLTMLIKSFVNVNALKGVETAEGRESGQSKEDGQSKEEQQQEKQGGQEKGNKISIMKQQKIKLRSILKSDSHNISGNYDNINSKANKKKYYDGRTIIDIKGTISITITITSFLIALTQLQTGSGSSNNTMDPMNLLQVIVFSAVSLASLAFFIRTERRSKAPLIDLNLIKDNFFLPSMVIVTIVGIAMFMIYPTIVQLVRSPQPFGFGGDAVAAGNVQLPFMIAFMILGPTGGIIISKLGSIKPLLIGSITIVVGFSLILVFHFTASMVMLNLVILGAGISIANSSALNVINTSTPKRFSGIALAVALLPQFTGMAIGPVIAGLYMQTHKILLNSNTISGSALSSYPSPEAYNLIFLTAVLLSILFIVFSVLLKKRAAEFGKTMVSNQGFSTWYEKVLMIKLSSSIASSN
jgi:MFS family permease